MELADHGLQFTLDRLDEIAMIGYGTQVLPSKKCSHGPIRFSYNPYFSACFFSVGTVFFSHNKSVGTVFRLVFSAKRTGPWSTTIVVLF